MKSTQERRRAQSSFVDGNDAIVNGVICVMRFAVLKIHLDSAGLRGAFNTKFSTFFLTCFSCNRPFDDCDT
jgi:hypothetical protein